MIRTSLLTRRQALASLGAASLAISSAHAAAPVYAEAFGVIPAFPDDQTRAMQAALDAAAAQGVALVLPAGSIFVRDLQLPGQLTVEGVPGATQLCAWNGGRIAQASNAANLVLRNIGFDARNATALEGDALLEITGGLAITIERCSFTNSPATGLRIAESGVTVSDCDFARHGDAAIHATDNRNLLITGNRVSDCGNAGIRVWRSEPGADGSIVTGNRIAKIDWRGGGNGQNGNGINIFRADEVIVADNHIADCAFSAIRLNTTNNIQVSGNLCLRSGEVAIFSEFDFSGSIIANNIVDTAAAGISMTNLDSGGQIAVCTGNIVRNITPLSVVNPDTRPYGIAAEAEAAITGNTVQNVPGIAIAAGNGPFLRNVLIASNVVQASNIGIAVSVVDGAGPVHIANNIISDARDHAVVGMAWSDIVEPDLITNAGRFANVTVDSVTVGSSPRN
ncbi:MAG TPA: TIGR03808 family TAT-translocated repetitive protein [Devosia sp.]|nr:TIGR03808 family TAT-translocated repetitive protein [Devosia sp.]